jgi:hypothetical protein
MLLKLDHVSYNKQQVKKGRKQQSKKRSGGEEQEASKRTVRANRICERWTDYIQPQVWKGKNAAKQKAQWRKGTGDKQENGTGQQDL